MSWLHGITIIYRGPGKSKEVPPLLGLTFNSLNIKVVQSEVAEVAGRSARTAGKGISDGGLDVVSQKKI